jgi:pilus assembly protein FimV
MGDALKTDMTRTGRLALKQVATAVALTAVICAAPSAWALSLGRLTVQSALGEGLRAEIDVTSLTPDEASNLRVRVAPPDSYRIAGVDYNPVLPATTVTLQRRADGTPFLKITSDQSVQEPFVDVILEISWSSGRLLREYTLLFDPPSTARAPSAPAPAIAAAAPSARIEPLVDSPVPASAAPMPAPTAPAPALLPSAAAPARGDLALRKSGAESAPAASGSQQTEYRVKRGDTLTSISSKLQSGGASLDQALVGMFRGNPQAFSGDNMNRLKAGVVLSMPSSEQIGAIDAQEARQIIQAQSADFNAYRQRLAASVPEPKEGTAPARQAGGKVRAEVQDNKQAQAQSQDRLRLDKGKLSTGAVVAGAEDAIAKERASREASARANEIQRNVEELKKLQAASDPQSNRKPVAAVAASSPLPTLSVGAAPEPARVAVSSPAVPPVAAATAEPAVSQASGADIAAAASKTASPTAVPTAPAASVLSPTPPPEQAGGEAPSLIDSLSDNPWVLPGAGLVLALLAGLGYYRLRGKSKEDAGVTSFLESRLQPDSFFGASGGQRIDTRDASGAPSSMSYSLSQIDAIGDVDPVAEADVYLAYGRDLQAEEILKEAMRANPDRLAIRTKLLEVYAKRRDTKGYELLAGELYSLTGGQGEDWVRAQELGRSIDPENTLYEPGGQPGTGSSIESGGGERLGASTMPQSIVPSPSRFEHSVPDLDLTGDIPSGSSADVDLDISVPALMDDVRASTSRSFSGALAGFDSTPSERGRNLDSRPHGLEFDLNDLPQFDVPAAPPSPKTPSIDLADISLDLYTAPSAPGNLASTDTMSAFDVEDDDGSDPLARKLELAEEFNQIGDYEGARDLLQEVIESADGALKAKAQAMLDGLA